MKSKRAASHSTARTSREGEILGKKVKFDASLAVFLGWRLEVNPEETGALPGTLGNIRSALSKYINNIDCHLFHGVSSWQCCVGLVMLIYWSW